MTIRPADGADARPATMAEELIALLYWLRAIEAAMPEAHDQFTDALAIAAKAALTRSEEVHRGEAGFAPVDIVEAHAHIDAAIAALNWIDAGDVDMPGMLDFADAFADARDAVRDGGGAAWFGASVALAIWTGDHPSAGWTMAEMHDGVMHTLGVVVAASLESLGAAVIGVAS